jgi:hypothetical protein
MKVSEDGQRVRERERESVWVCEKHTICEHRVRLLLLFLLHMLIFIVYGCLIYILGRKVDVNFPGRVTVVTSGKALCPTYSKKYQVCV